MTPKRRRPRLREITIVYLNRVDPFVYVALR